MNKYSAMTLAQLREAAADLHADQQAMPDPGALQAHRDIVQAAFDRGARVATDLAEISSGRLVKRTFTVRVQDDARPDHPWFGENLPVSHVDDDGVIWAHVNGMPVG